MEIVAGGMQIVVARGLRRLIGLAGRPDLPAGAALHLPRCRSVHTFGMRFALDLLWLDGAGGVVRIDRAVPPCRVRSCRRARSVLELRAAPAGITGAGGAVTPARSRRRRLRRSRRR